MKSKKARIRKTLKDDRISTLSEDLLCLILSFLPTKDSVRTSALSKRWKFLFASVPVLDFEDFSPTRNKLNNAQMIRNFTKFVDGVFMLYKVSHMRKLRIYSSPLLECDEAYENTHVDSWISAAVIRDVQELDLQLRMIRDGPLPRDLFTCKTLEVLKLIGNFVICVPGSVCLSSLKILRLEFVILRNDDSANMLFSGCPVLEDLFLCGCVIENIEVLNLSVPALRRFEMVFCGGEYKLELNVPNLEYLNYAISNEKSYLGDTLKSLVEARLHVDVSNDQNNENGLPKLLHIVCDASSLYISGNTMEVFFYSRCSLPTFHNLTHLKLDIIGEGWRLLPNMLESSPYLEHLVLCEIFEDYFIEKCTRDDFLPKHVPICFSLRLEEIELYDFCGGKQQLILVEYFLKNARVLRKMTIHMSPGEESQFQISKILAFSMCSKTCQIVLT